MNATTPRPTSPPAAAARADRATPHGDGIFRSAFELAGLGVVLVARDGTIVEANRAFRDLSGYGEAELRGTPLDALHDADAMIARMLAGDVDRLELPRRLRRRDGALRDVFVRATALRDAGGTLRHAIALVEDVSEKRRMEAQLVLADRMASVGTLAAGVAHEINSPLSSILANLDFVLRELRGATAATDEDVLRALADAREAAVRVRGIVGDLRTVAKAGDGMRETLDVRRVLQCAIGLAASEIRDRAALVVVAGEVPPVVASENRLAQLFLNLLVNAAQAIPAGRGGDHVVRATTATAPDGRAVVEIADTGAGIAAEVLPRIFDPFFTTKPVGIGTGLGLSICHGIVAELGGEIAVESAPGRGSTFRVLLPAARDAARAQPPAPPAACAATRRRVLVVDDEPLVGRAVARILSAEHEVVTCTSAREALEALGSGAPFDLVVCDLMMPGMSGMQLHEALAGSPLQGRIVFLTGGAYTPASREFLERVPNPHLEKPFDPGVLRGVVARALAGERPAAP